MYKKHKHDIIILLTVFTLGVSLYLAIVHYMGFLVPCTITHGCETVLNSKYSVLVGLPLSVWGVLYSLAVIVLALLANHYKKAQSLLNWLLGLGAVGSVIFLSIQFFVLKQVCQYCFTFDTLNIVIFLFNLNAEFVLSTDHR